MVEIVISYSGFDKSRADELGAKLTQCGFHVWWASKVEAGASLAKQTVEHLEAASAILVLWSSRALESYWVDAEASLALGRGAYLGVLLEPDLSLPSPFARQQNVYWASDTTIASLVQSLRSLGIGEAADAPAIKVDQAKSVTKGYAFISHVEEDLTALSQISGFLRDRGYAYWSYHESDRDYQKPTHLEIEERLAESALMLTVLSPEWKRSEWTSRELWFAREIRKPMFLLRFRNPGPTLAIAGDTYIDFEGNRTEGFRRLGIELDRKGL